MQKAIFNIKGMTCGHCVQTVQSALDQLEGVQETHVSLADQQAVLLYEGSLKTQEILDAVVEAGYQASPVLTSS
ncbi:MAG: heavy-metal-associated domain-containing protein [bacterium]